MKIRSVDISQTASASSLIFDALRRAIIEGHLRVGEPLRQEEIARQFNTSRIPVREALSRLEQHGLITTQRYKGAVVAGLSQGRGGRTREGQGAKGSDVAAVRCPVMATFPACDCLVWNRGCLPSVGRPTARGRGPLAGSPRARR